MTSSRNFDSLVRRGLWRLGIEGQTIFISGLKKAAFNRLAAGGGTWMEVVKKDAT